MPRFCIPCWPSKATVHLLDEQKSEVVPVKELVLSGKEQILDAKPSTAEYAGEATKQFLDVLESVGDLIPVPGFPTAVKIAKSIMQACDDTHATLERAEELKLRIKKLVAFLVDDLKEKKKEEIQKELQDDINRLSKDLEYIQMQLNEIASQKAFLLIFFRGLNDTKVKKCVDRLDNSLENFSFAQQFKNGILLNTLETRILDFHTSHQKTLDSIQVDIKDIKAILVAQGPSIARSPSHPQGRATIPPNTSVFHGRDTLVEQLVGILTSNPNGQKPPCVCLLGPGGMGKTSTALAVMWDPKMRTRFPENNQIWVPCVKATSYLLFLDTLYSSLGITHKTGDTISDIIFEINLSTEPLVILLDNFETVWNVEESRNETKEALERLNMLPNTILFMTIRSSTAPCANWKTVPLDEVDEIAARKIYLDICPAGSDDNQLSELLKSLGYMPLAITLMANMALSLGLGANELMENYRQKGTAMVGQGVDAKYSLDICISLSVDSKTMHDHPDAYKLLVALAMLPVGTTYDVLSKWWARDSPNLIGALTVLADMSLIKRRNNIRYFVLPVIRSYVLDSHPPRFLPDVSSAMITSACNFLKHHKSSSGDRSCKDRTKALSSEEGNLLAILLTATGPEPCLIEAFLVLVEHQLLTRPRLEVIEHTLELARRMNNNEKLVGDVLTCYGRVLLELDRYEDAVKQHTLARNTFLSISDDKAAARSLLYIVGIYVYTMQLSFDVKQNLDLIQQAESVYKNDGNDDGRGVALCLFYRGPVVARDALQSHELGINSLVRALEIFKAHGDTLYVAKTSFFLALVYYWARRYDDASLSATAAIEAYELVEEYSGKATALLGKILFMQGYHKKALETMVRALQTCKAYGSPRDMAEALEMIGRIYVKLDQLQDARSVYEDALKYHEIVPHKEIVTTGIKRTQFFIQQLDEPSLVPSTEVKKLLARQYSDF